MVVFSRAWTAGNLSSHCAMSRRCCSSVNSCRSAEKPPSRPSMLRSSRAWSYRESSIGSAAHPRIRRNGG
eukprot:3933436-Rhodomonas_salina.1